jgi:hypothetical protein
MSRWFLKGLEAILIVVALAAFIYGFLLLFLNSTGPQGTYTISGRVIGLEYSQDLSHLNELSVKFDNQFIDGCDVTAQKCYSGVVFEYYTVPLSELDGITIGDQVSLQCVIGPSSFDVRQMMNRVNCNGLKLIK